MLELRLKYYCLSFDFTFFAVLALYSLLDRSGYALLFLLACLCHEAGHLFVMKCSGFKVDRVLFYGKGMKIECDEKCRTIAVLLAGCTTNFLLAFLFFTVYEQNSIQNKIFVTANVLVGLMNLIPIGSLDGENLLRKLLFYTMKPQTAERILLIIEKIAFFLAFITFIAAIYLGLLNISLIIILIYNILIEITEKVQYNKCRKCK